MMAPMGPFCKPHVQRGVLILTLLSSFLVFRCSQCDGIAFYLFRFRHHAVMENGRQITPTKSGNTSKGPGDQILKPNQ